MSKSAEGPSEGPASLLPFWTFGEIDKVKARKVPEYNAYVMNTQQTTMIDGYDFDFLPSSHRILTYSTIYV